MEIDTMLIFLLMIMVFFFIVAVIAWAWNRAKSQQRYEDALEDLENQLREGLISEETYKSLRLDLENKYYKNIKRGLN